MRVLLVEDDKMIGSALQRGLSKEGYTVDWVRDGVAADTAVATEPYAVVVLDLGLPGKDGTRVLATMRQRRCDTPVIIVTARDSRDDRIHGLDLGADDYVVKPFDLDELAARIRAVTRRHAGRSDPLIRHGSLTLDPVARALTRDGEAIPLTAREFALLHTLMQRPTAVFSRQALEESLYGWDDTVGSNAVEVHIHHIRRKLGAEIIENIRGQGYRLGRTT